MRNSGMGVEYKTATPPAIVALVHTLCRDTMERVIKRSEDG